MPTSEDDWRFMAHLMYDTIKMILDNIVDDDIPSALVLGAAILNDYEEVCNGQ